MSRFEELPENEAAGEIAAIYARIRALHGVPYVSSLYRHLATHPGVLEWTWALIGPAMRDGRIQATAWTIAAQSEEEPLPRLSPAALSVFGVDAAGLQAIRAVCDSFLRVAPSNLLAAGCLAAALQAERLPDGTVRPMPDWHPPAALPPLPRMASPESADPAVGDLLQQFATPMGDQRFVPGLYRMLVHWPGYLAHVAGELVPRLADPGWQARGEAIAARIVAAVPGILPACRLPTDRARPEPGLEPALLAAIATYRCTSPQMIMVSQLLRDALPER